MSSYNAGIQLAASDNETSEARTQEDQSASAHNIDMSSDEHHYDGASRQNSTIEDTPFRGVPIGKGQGSDPGLSKDWSILANEVWSYEKERVERWRNEIDKLLIFAGLFSAVVTAFVSQFYAVLLPPPDFNTMILQQHTQILERTTMILERISSQLSNNETAAAVFTAAGSSGTIVLANSPNTNVSLPPPPPRWIAQLWFVSLVFSLAAASVALAVNQWLNFHAEQAGLRSAPQKLWTWRLRRDALNKYQVELIVSLLPCLLQVALVLFLVGIMGYLREVGNDITIPSAIFICALLLFLVITSFLPAFVEYSPYKSPQAWWICQLSRSMQWAVCWALDQMLELRRWSNSLKHGRQPTTASYSRAPDPGYLKERRAHLQALMTSDWLGHEQLCLRGSTSLHAETTLFSDIYHIAPDVDVIRAMETCLNDIFPSSAVTNVMAIGKARCKALSIRLERSSIETTCPWVSSHDLGSDSIYERLDGIVTLTTGRMVLDAFIRQHDSDAAEEQHSTTANQVGRTPYLRTGKDLFEESLMDRDVLAGLIRAMPYAHGTEACMVLFQCLTRAELGPPGRRAVLDVIQRVYLARDWHRQCTVIHPELCRLRSVQDWDCLVDLFSAVRADRDSMSVIQLVTIILAVCAMDEQYEIDCDSPSPGAYLGDVLEQFESYLALCGREDVQDVKAELSPATIYKFNWTLRLIPYASSGPTDSSTRIFSSLHGIARQLKWLFGAKLTSWMDEAFLATLREAELADDTDSEDDDHLAFQLEMELGQYPGDIRQQPTPETLLNRFTKCMVSETVKRTFKWPAMRRNDIEMQDLEASANAVVHVPDIPDGTLPAQAVDGVVAPMVQGDAPDTVLGVEQPQSPHYDSQLNTDDVGGVGQDRVVVQNGGARQNGGERQGGNAKKYRTTSQDGDQRGDTAQEGTSTAGARVHTQPKPPTDSQNSG